MHPNCQFYPHFFYCPAELWEGVGVSVISARAQSLSLGDASNGPVNILTAVLFVGVMAAGRGGGGERTLWVA